MIALFTFIIIYWWASIKFWCSPPNLPKENATLASKILNKTNYEFRFQMIASSRIILARTEEFQPSRDKGCQEVDIFKLRMAPFLSRNTLFISNAISPFLSIHLNTIIFQNRDLGLSTKRSFSTGSHKKERPLLD